MEPQTIIARRIARELKPGMLINLGIGIPTLVAKYLPEGMSVFFQSENGLIGTGAPPEEGMGGAMDLVTGAKRVIVAMQHAAKGKSKIVKRCSLPITSTRPVDMVVTDLAVIAFPNDRAMLIETAPSVSVADVVKLTEAELIVPDHVPEMSF
jgi:acyl CoA:acetate/3-ketoacid CoA transferase beta subunit